MQRTQAPEVEIGSEIQLRKGQLQGDGEANQKARHAPEHRGYNAPADDLVIIFSRWWRAEDTAPPRRIGDLGVIGPADREPQADQRRCRQNAHMHGKADIHGRNHGDGGKNCRREPQ